MQLKNQTKIPMMDQIRMARERKGLSKADVAKALKCTEQSVKYWEGEGKEVIPRRKIQEKLEELLGIRLSTTGNVSGGMPDYSEGISAEALDLARAIEAMPKDLRQHLVAIIDRLVPGFRPIKTRRTKAR